VQSRSPQAATGPGGVGLWAAVRKLSSTAESRLVGLTALVQGMALVTFPAASGIIMGSRSYALSGVQYGELVLPGLATAILASLTGFGLARRRPTRLAYRIGVALSLLSTALLLATAPVEGQQAFTFPMLLTASALLGAGFGLILPIVMAYSRFLHATDEDPSLLVLNALLALGALIAPAIAVGFAQLDWWWGLPSLVAALLIILLLLSRRLPSYVGPSRGPAAQSRKRTLRFFFYAVFAMVYAVCAAIIVVWCQLRMPSVPTSPAPAQLTAAVRLGGHPDPLRSSLVLAALWGGLLVAARVAYAGVDRWLVGVWRLACYVLPMLVLAALVAAGLLTRHRELAVVAVFLVAILGSTALLPLRLNFSRRDVIAITAALAGGMAAYQLAYGFMADGLRPARLAGQDFIPIFVTAALVGIIMAATTIATMHQRQAVPVDGPDGERRAVGWVRRLKARPAGQPAAAGPSPFPTCSSWFAGASCRCPSGRHPAAPWSPSRRR
jgi:MFS family permease